MITAKIIADSISPSGVRLTTLQLRYPRFIHSEFMTHRQFSRNASSSRAIPVSKMIEQVRTEPAEPIHWGRNQPGMQADEETHHIGIAQNCWKLAANDAAHYAEILAENARVHKQVANRILEPFTFISVVVTATEWDNFFALRLHPDAQPEIQELARCMKAAMDASEPKFCDPGDWHLPYITGPYPDDVEQAKLISAARCARVSYLNHDQSEPDTTKDLALAERLAESGHWSPFEHQAAPLSYHRWLGGSWETGVTHVDRDRNLWSGNLRGWVQHRCLKAAE